MLLGHGGTYLPDVVGPAAWAAGHCYWLHLGHTTGRFPAPSAWCVDKMVAPLN
ncbi:hypothetical protein GCM10009612_75170 [Streptomyces beijiangensis]